VESPIPVTETVEWGTIDVQDHFNITGLEDEVLITITFNRNYSEDRINGVLDFYSEGRKFYSLPIEQEGAVYRLDCTPDKQKANCNGDVINIAVDCNTSWTAKVSTESTAGVVIDTDIIFNTVPSLILDADMLTKTARNTLIIDLASRPGGVDFEAAHKMGIKVIWALSLPGKVAPDTAGDIIGKTILNILDELEAK
jgi:hypothetical protein